MGAAGAVWGSSDALSLREAPRAEEAARLAAMLTGGIFFVRYWWRAKHRWQHQRDYSPTKTNHRRTRRLAFFQIHASKLVLEVLGGMGAIWGCSEALMLRHSNNEIQWRMAATAVGSMFLVRWTFQMAAYCLYLEAFWSDPSSIHMAILRCYEVLIVKLILEVAGAVGAVWGCSEILTLRNSETNKIWRPIAVVVGAIFLVRWSHQLMNFVGSERKIASRQLLQVDEARSDEVEDLSIADLHLKETTDTLLDENTSM
eukprot:CAMPEP_0172570336 /NCGR_PEP_ID=MMETSP1067-20121228/127197_1 /TAXON_ID=265564 ORGANISM="Thalassiosira punctigera, Strain Tpunct2005C2" /NCGR_SAMPLE_ID=MMETSP1067 /ASSEMBLY_ACC=CAM_ASM_000444 /LENGTH=256 /DNA_ID=CAMNT_0013362405 /DNA_START=188 /DNA_END=958 /DNA_ORIENTATION=-